MKSSVLILAGAALLACSREPPPAPEKTVFDAQLKAIDRAKGVEKMSFERKSELDAKLDRESGDE